MQIMQLCTFYPCTACYIGTVFSFPYNIFFFGTNLFHICVFHIDEWSELLNRTMTLLSRADPNIILNVTHLDKFMLEKSSNNGNLIFSILSKEIDENKNITQKINVKPGPSAISPRTSPNWSLCLYLWSRCSI